MHLAFCFQLSTSLFWLYALEKSRQSSVQIVGHFPPLPSVCRVRHNTQDKRWTVENSNDITFMEMVTNCVWELADSFKIPENNPIRRILVRPGKVESSVCFNKATILQIQSGLKSLVFSGCASTQKAWQTCTHFYLIALNLWLWFHLEWVQYILMFL